MLLVLTRAGLREELETAMREAVLSRDGELNAQREMIQEELSRFMTVSSAGGRQACDSGGQKACADFAEVPEKQIDPRPASAPVLLGNVGVHAASQRASLPGYLEPLQFEVPQEGATPMSALNSPLSPLTSPRSDVSRERGTEQDVVARPGMADSMGASRTEDNYCQPNFPNDLRLPASFRRSQSAASGAGVTRRASMRAQRRASLGPATRRGSLPGIGRRRCSVDSVKTTDSAQTLSSAVALPIQTRRPSFMGTRLNLEELQSEALPESRLEWLVYHPFFDIAIALLIILNGISIGIQTDCMAREVTDLVPPVLRATEVFFCAIFSLELILRISVEGRLFFIGLEWSWNLFDCCVVMLQLFEEIMGAVTSSTDNDGEGSRTNFSFMRVLRVLRLIRIVRIVRVLRFIGELRTIVTSIASSMKHLLWTVMLLLLMIYTISVYFTQLVLDHRLGGTDRDLSNLVTPWGSLARSALTVFSAISGGIDWETAVVPLAEHISALLAPLFCLYVAFAILALMNVVTGVFVENAIDSANRDKERYLVQTVRELFEKADLSREGVISWKEFESQLSNPELQTLFSGLGIDQVSARGLFKLLDIDNSGSIDANELITGTLRLRGEARSIDLAALIYENRRTARSMHQALARMQYQMRTCAIAPAAADASAPAATDPGCSGGGVSARSQ